MQKFGKPDIDRAIIRMATNLKFFPSDPAIRAEIGVELARMCPHLEALEWLTDAMCRKVSKWDGANEMRGVLCWKFRPADGYEVESSTAGFTAGDGEMASVAPHHQNKLLGAPEGEIKADILKIAAAKRLA